MDILEQLESEIQDLLVRNKDLLAAATQARTLLADAEEQCSVLKEENRTIRQALEDEKALRRDAVALPGGASARLNDNVHVRGNIGCEQLVNAFDLVRIHKFLSLDDDVNPATPPFTQGTNFLTSTPDSEIVTP